MAATSVMQPKDVSFGSHFYVYTVILPNLSFDPIYCRMQPNSYSADCCNITRHMPKGNVLTGSRIN